MIELLKYIILGLVQGIAEVLPISSSGHLTIANHFLQMEENSLALNVFLHIASLLAVIVFLRKELIYIIKGFFIYLFKRNEEYLQPFKIALYLVVATIPLVIFALILKIFDYETSPIWLVGVALCFNGAMLFVLGKFTGTKTFKEMTFKNAFIIGLFQCLGAFAGVSRSGSCLSGCQVSKIEKNTSAKFAFLLFVPVAVGALVLELPDMGQMVLGSTPIYFYIIAFLVTAVTTYVAFAFLKKIIEKGSIRGFGYYCLILGVIIFIYGVVKNC